MAKTTPNHSDRGLVWCILGVDSCLEQTKWLASETTNPVCKRNQTTLNRYPVQTNPLEPLTKGGIATSASWNCLRELLARMCYTVFENKLWKSDYQTRSKAQPDQNQTSPNQWMKPRTLLDRSLYKQSSTMTWLFPFLKTLSPPSFANLWWRRLFG